MFHFCLVINENTCEVYINAQLVKTQVLFGEQDIIKEIYILIRREI